MLENLLKEVTDNGWQVNNLFQHKSGYWQCNLRSADGQWATAWGQGLSAGEAVTAAIDMAESMSNWVEIPEHGNIAAVEEVYVDLQKVLCKLVKMPVIQRRF